MSVHRGIITTVYCCVNQQGAHCYRDSIIHSSLSVFTMTTSIFSYVYSKKLFRVFLYHSCEKREGEGSVIILFRNWKDGADRITDEPARVKPHGTCKATRRRQGPWPTACPAPSITSPPTAGANATGPFLSHRTRVNKGRVCWFSQLCSQSVTATW